MAWYRTGTITVTNGSTTVTGSGTAWIANAGVGEALYAPDGRLYEIASISSDTTMTLASAYLGSNQSGQAYVIVPSQSYIRDLAAQAADLVNNYSTIYNTVGQGKFPDGTLAAPSIRFSDDLDTGFYRSASNEVTFVAGGVAQFKYNSNGLTLLNGSQSFTTIDATTLEVTNIKAKDGTTAIAIADSTGVATISANPVFSGGTANGVAYLNASKVLTTGSALTFDGTNFGIGTNSPSSYLAGVPGLAIRGQFAGISLSDSTSNTYWLNYNDQGNLLWYRNAVGEVMRLTSTGLGIGTSSPVSKLQSLSAVSALTSNNGFSSLPLTVSDSTALAADTGGGINFSAIITAAGAYNSIAAIRAGRTAATTFDYRGYLSFYTANNSTGYPIEQMRLDSSGNLGLGVTPSDWNSTFKSMQVGATGAVFGRTSGSGAQVWLGQNAYYGASGWVYTQTAAASLIELAGNVIGFSVAPSGTAGNAISFTQAMTLNASGFLGVGITSPQNRLDVREDGVYPVSWGSSSTLYGFLSYASGAAVVGSTTSTSLAFYTNGSERMRIDSSGNVLVGTTDAGQDSGVGAKIIPNGTGKAFVNVSQDTTSSNQGILMYSTGAAAYRFYVGWDGTINATNTTISAISDQRLKENVQDLDVGLDAVMALKPRKFDWKEGKGKNIKGDRGFIAQEFEQVFPDLIDEWKDPAPEGEDPYKAVRQDIIPVLVKAIQEQQDIINSLKARLDAAGL